MEGGGWGGVGVLVVVGCGPGMFPSQVSGGPNWPGEYPIGATKAPSFVGPELSAVKKKKKCCEYLEGGARPSRTEVGKKRCRWPKGHDHMYHKKKRSS